MAKMSGANPDEVLVWTQPPENPDDYDDDEKDDTSPRCC